MKNLSKNLIWAVVSLISTALVFSMLFTNSAQKIKDLSLNELAEKINIGEVKNIKVAGEELKIILIDDSRAVSRKEREVGLIETLTNYGVGTEALKKVGIVIEDESGFKYWLSILLPSILPVILLLVIFSWFFRQAGRGVNQAFSFGKVNIRLFAPAKNKLTFKDVAGLKEAKEELEEIVDFLKNPKKFLDMGARIPRGVLLVGPPGTGKTLLARAVANEANVPFFHISASEFVEMFVGVGASVTGNTPVLIRAKNNTKLLPIGEFIDQFYQENEEGLKNIEGIKTLGVDFARGTKFFKSSNWKNAKAVYRHKVNKIYEIEFVGGKIKTTGDHSVFVRNKNHIICKRADELKIGDILVGLPYSVRGGYLPELLLGKRSLHYAKAHNFPENLPFEEIIVWPLENANFNSPTEFVPSSINERLNLPERQNVGVKTLTPQVVKNLVYKIKITPALMKLLGYYTAEGDYHKKVFRFSFGAHEQEYHKECVKLVKEIFNLEPNFYFTKNNAVMIQYNSESIGQFFVKYCGQGAHNKHLPEFIWDLPKEYFVSYLDGLVAGDGWINKRGMIEFSSCSKQLISELRWLLNMHGIPCSVTEYKKPAGHKIKNGNPLPESIYWRITIASLVNPLTGSISARFLKRPIIKKIVAKPYNDYVYDFCGCENEAFFGGDKPILLHNSRVRDLFQTAKRAGRSIIFIDEIDAVGRERGAGLGGGHDEREQTLNQILVEMDGFDRDDTRIVISATNRPDILDPALLRPGRFDRRIILDMPDINDREEILKIHSKGKLLAKDVILRTIAVRTPGFSGADLANLMNEAAIWAARQDKKEIEQIDIINSIEKVVLGPERKSRTISPKEKEITAYHEAGHSLAAAALKDADPIHKISIVSRGIAGGYTIKLPLEEMRLKTKSQFLAEIAVALGGYVAELIKFKEVTTGSANDLKQTTRLANRLVTQYGMSETLGPRTFGKTQELIFLGREITTEKDYSEEIAAKIDAEVNGFIEKALIAVKKIISANKNILDEIAEALIKKESLEQEEFYAIIKKYALKQVAIK